jgi:hypothetical protein
MINSLICISIVPENTIFYNYNQKELSPNPKEKKEKTNFYAFSMTRFKNS